MKDNIKRKAKFNEVYTKDEQGNFIYKDMGKLYIGDITLEQFVNQTQKYYDTVTNEIHYLKDLLKDAQFIHPDKRYAVVGVKNGYICEGGTHVVELTVDENELYKGYCEIVQEGNVKKAVINDKQKARYLKTFEGGII